MTSVFISAVSREFKSYRSDLTLALTRKGFHVKVEEHFTCSEKLLLDYIHDFIKDCDIVICLVGDRSGTNPEEYPTEKYQHIAKGEYSYTQWEYIFAKHYDRNIFVFCPLDGAPRDFEIDPEDKGETKQKNNKKNKGQAFYVKIFLSIF